MGQVTGSYNYNTTCDVCGFKYKASELRKRWDGLMVCKDDYETRHPSDFYRVKNDSHVLPFTRLDPVDYMAEYEGILDNYIDTMAVPAAGGLSSNIWGHGFNTLVPGEVVGIKFYLDFQNGKYRDTMDGTAPFRVVLQRLHDFVGSDLSEPTILGLWDFYPPFKDGWNYRLLPQRVTLARHRTYILARSWDNANATGVTANDGTLHKFEYNPYLQYGTNLNNFGGGSSVNAIPAYQASSLVPIDVLFIPTDTTVDDNAGIFDHKFGTNWDRSQRGYTLGNEFSDRMRSVLGTIQENCTITGMRFWPVDDYGSTRVMLWSGTTGFVESESGDNMVALPNMWNYVAWPTPVTASAGENWVVSIHNEGGGNTLAEFNYVYGVGTGETANSRVHYFANYNRATYGYPAGGLATIESANLPYMIDFVTQAAPGGGI